MPSLFVSHHLSAAESCEKEHRRPCNSPKPQRTVSCRDTPAVVGPVDPLKQFAAHYLARPRKVWQSALETPTTSTGIIDRLIQCSLIVGVANDST